MPFDGREHGTCHRIKSRRRTGHRRRSGRGRSPGSGAWRRQSDALSSACALVDGVAVWGDLGQAETAPRIVDRAAAELGPLDILVNCAGFVLPQPVDAVDTQIETTLDVNLRGAFLCTQCGPAHAIRRLRPDHQISSQAAEVSIGGYLPYSVSKAGLEIMTKYLAVDGRGRDHRQCRRPGIRQNRSHRRGVRGPAVSYQDQLDRIR